MRSLFLGFAAVLALSGCGVKGSCDQRANGAARCQEITSGNIVDTARYGCTNAPSAKERGKWAEKTKCDRTGAIAGCETNLDRTWYYPGDRISKVEHVKTMCSSGKLLDANGKELKDVSAEPVPQTGPVSDPALDAMITPVRGPLAAVVSGIDRIRLATGSTGPVRLTGGKHVAGPTVAAVYDADVTYFGDPKAEYRKTYPLKDSDDLAACGMAFKAKERQSRADADMARIIKWCSQLTTLLVVTTSKLDGPTIRGVSDFNSGYAIGTVRAYELPSGKPAGSYAFKAESSDKLKPSQMEGDFLSNYGKALTAGLAKSDPGATYAFEVRSSRN